MANPRLPGISENEQALLYAKLNEYNRGRAMICHRTSTNPSAWQVLCSIIQGDA